MHQYPRLACRPRVYHNFHRILGHSHVSSSMTYTQDARARRCILKQSSRLSQVRFLPRSFIMSMISIVLDEQSCVLLLQHSKSSNVGAQPPRPPRIGGLHRKIAEELPDGLPWHQQLRQAGQKLHLCVAAVHHPRSTLPPPGRPTSRQAQQTTAEEPRSSSEVPPRDPTPPLARRHLPRPPLRIDWPSSFCAAARSSQQQIRPSDKARQPTYMLCIYFSFVRGRKTTLACCSLRIDIACPLVY